MQSPAVVMRGPGVLALEELALAAPGGDDLVVDICWSGISTGTEKLFWTGRMPSFPGMSYPLVPGYEAAGEVVEAGPYAPFRPGDFVFVPGASCFDGAVGLFGGAAGRLVTRADRVVRVDRAAGAEGALLALAATARHAIAGIDKAMPELIVGHGVMGRLLARLVVAAGAPPPTVWENRAERRSGACGYPVIAPEDDPRRDYGVIYDASGDGGMLNSLIGRLRKGGEMVLAGFYPGDIAFAFAPAFMREVRLHIAAEWTKADLLAVSGLVDSGMLSLAGLVTHQAPASAAQEAYPTAFGDPNCLKMVLNWKDAA